MTVVLVHGNPETPAVWDPLVAELGRDDVVRLAPPGFGAPVPGGFAATVDGYRDWLISELEGIDGPIDLVGHDWGGGHVINAVLARPDLVRSWASDILGAFEPDYVWHDLAQAWQTPEVGEEHIARMLGGPVDAKAFRMEGFGVPTAVAEAIAAEQDEAMQACVLTLYRDAARPGLGILATDDPFVGDDAMRRRAAGRAGAQVAVLDGLGHWWLCEDPARGAAALTDFWAGLPG